MPDAAWGNYNDPARFGTILLRLYKIECGDVEMPMRRGRGAQRAASVMTATASEVRRGLLEAGLVLPGSDASELAEDAHEVTLARKPERHGNLAGGQPTACEHVL